jgi:hypothetical protein
MAISKDDAQKILGFVDTKVLTDGSKLIIDYDDFIDFIDSMVESEDVCPECGEEYFFYAKPISKYKLSDQAVYGCQKCSTVISYPDSTGKADKLQSQAEKQAVLNVMYEIRESLEHPIDYVYAKIDQIISDLEM